MSLVSSVLNGVRYDLRNYADIDFDSVLLINYLNRAIRTLDYTLGAHNSDWTLNNGDVTLLDTTSSIAVPTGAFNLREVWVGTSRKEQLAPMDLYYTAQFRSGEAAEFNYWAHVADNIVVDVAADGNTTVTVFYDKLTTAVSAESGTMPYQGRFDDMLREAVVLLCESKKYKSPQEADAMYAQIFAKIVQSDLVNRRYVKKHYRLDF